MVTDNESLLARRHAAVPRGVSNSTGIFAARAENAELWDTEGKRYVDFAGGIAVLNTGHRHPHVIAAVERQLSLYTHTAFQVVPYEPYVELAERLNALAPFSGDAKTLLLSTGAEAVENAVKIARAATRRSAVIAFSGAFHGRTMYTMALTGKVAPYKRAFGPMPGPIYHARFPAEAMGVSVDDTLADIAQLFKCDVDPGDVAAFIVEPVQGEGGFHAAPTTFLRELRKLADTHGILLIADEVQSGFARTGKMFAIEHSGVEPDLVTIAKSLAGGFPLSGVIGRKHLMDSVEPGGLGGTYAGSPVACAAALAVLDVIARENLCARADEIGEIIKARLGAFAGADRLTPIANIRGHGAMIGFDIVSDKIGGKPDATETGRVVSHALDLGLLLLSCGVYGNTVRILVPLTVSDAHLREGLDLLEKAMAR